VIPFWGRNRQDGANSCLKTRWCRRRRYNGGINTVRTWNFPSYLLRICSAGDIRASGAVSLWDSYNFAGQVVSKTYGPAGIS
jgi:hypothetical protein